MLTPQTFGKQREFRLHSLVSNWWSPFTNISSICANIFSHRPWISNLFKGLWATHWAFRPTWDKDEILIPEFGNFMDIASATLLDTIEARHSVYAIPPAHFLNLVLSILEFVLHFDQGQLLSAILKELKKMLDHAEYLNPNRPEQKLSMLLPLPMYHRSCRFKVYSGIQFLWCVECFQFW